VFSIAIALNSCFSFPSSSTFAFRLWFGKYIRPSLMSQPLLWAKETTAPSLSRKRRFLVEEMGSEG
jgi:hypothetical protein